MGFVPGWRDVKKVDGVQPPSIEAIKKVNRNFLGEIQRNQSLRIIGTYSNVGTAANNAGNFDVYITKSGVPDIRIAFYNKSLDKIVPVPGKEEEYTQYFGPDSENPDLANRLKIQSVEAIAQTAQNQSIGARTRDVAALISAGKAYDNYFTKPNNGTGGANGISTDETDQGDEIRPKTENGANPSPDGASIPIEEGPLLNFNPQKFADSLKLNEVLKYPEKINEGSDFLKISCFEYIPSGFERQGIKISDSSRFIDKSRILGSVFLPIQSASEGNSVDWGNGDSLNAIQMAGLGPAINAIKTASTGNVVGAGQQLFGELMYNLRALGSNLSENDVLAYFGGQAIGSNVFSRATGQVLNNNLELLYNGTSLRSFAYNYRFTPRSDTESIMVRKIIKFFKRQMSAKKSDLFLGAPNVFKLEYIYGKTKNLHPYLNKIKPCALVGFNVNYIPDNSYMTYGDGGMTSYQVSMAFTEINPIYDVDNQSIDDETTGY